MAQYFPVPEPASEGEPELNERITYEAPPEASVEASAPAPSPPYPSQPLSLEDERTWAMLAHLSVLLNLVTGFFGPIAALVIYLGYKDRSRYVAYHAMQSFVFQLIWWVGGGVLIAAIWVITTALTAVLIGLVCLPFAILITPVLAAMPLVALVYGVIGAIQVNQGRDFRYWLVGDWVRSTLTGG